MFAGLVCELLVGERVCCAMACMGRRIETIVFVGLEAPVVNPANCIP